MNLIVFFLYASEVKLVSCSPYLRILSFCGHRSTGFTKSMQFVSVAEGQESSPLFIRLMNVVLTGIIT